MIEITGIRKAFNQGRDNEFWALNGIDLTIPPRQVTAFFGPSGSGKTTLLTIVGCLARPHRRPRAAQGPRYFRSSGALPDQIRRRTFGFIFQQFNLIRGLSAIENIMLPAYPLGGEWRALRERAESMLESLKLGHRRAARVEWLRAASSNASPSHAP